MNQKLPKQWKKQEINLKPFGLQGYGIIKLPPQRKKDIFSCFDVVYSWYFEIVTLK